MTPDEIYAAADKSENRKILTDHTESLDGIYLIIDDTNTNRLAVESFAAIMVYDSDDLSLPGGIEVKPGAALYILPGIKGTNGGTLSIGSEDSSVPGIESDGGTVMAYNIQNAPAFGGTVTVGSGLHSYKITSESGKDVLSTITANELTGVEDAADMIADLTAYAVQNGWSNWTVKYDKAWLPAQLVSYNVTYDANRGTGAPEPQTKIESVTLMLSETVPTWEYFTFLGWATAKDATEAEYQPGDAYTADADLKLYAVWDANCVNSGKCGDDLTWKLYEGGLLTIEGTGDMWENGNSYDFSLYADDIKKVVIGSGVTSINLQAFGACSALTDVYYLGTQAQWKEVVIDPGNDNLKNAKLHFGKPNDGPDDPLNPIELHLGSLVPGLAPTKDSAGYKEYYQCLRCNKYFEDKLCTVEITDLAKWKAEGGNGYIAPLSDRDDPTVPKTGDTSHPALWAVLLIASLTVIYLVPEKKKKA